MAILKACELCSSNDRLEGCKIQVVSDSMEAVSWVNNTEDYGNIKNLQAIRDIRGFIRNFEGLSVIFNSSSLNEDADHLARRSSGGGEDNVQWFEF